MTKPRDASSILPSTPAATPTGLASLTLRITGNGKPGDYRVRPAPAHDPAQSRFAWTLLKVGATDRYLVQASPLGSTCSCPDATYRARDCRHQLACRKLGLIP